MVKKINLDNIHHSTTFLIVINKKAINLIICTPASILCAVDSQHYSVSSVMIINLGVIDRYLYESIGSFLFILLFLLFALSTFIISMSLALTQFVQRPSFGHQGDKIKVRANFFEVVDFPRADFHHYDVTFDPPSTPVALYKRIWTTLCDNKENGIHAAFDGKKNCFAITPLALNDNGQKAFEVKLHMIVMIKYSGCLN